MSSVECAFVLSSENLNESMKYTIIKIIKEERPETIGKLIKFVQQTTAISEKEIINLLNQLETEDKIQLTTKRELASAPVRFSFFSSALASYIALIVVAFATTISVFTIPQDSYPLAYVRNILGVIFVLFLPGYAFIKAFFPAKVPIKTASESLDNIERFVLSIGMSIALAPMVGLILYYTSVGIGLTPMTLSLLALTGILATAALARHYRAKWTTIQRTSDFC